MNRNSTYRIIMSGGGTGGHIFPAIAIANGLRQAHPPVDILFVGASGRMEMEKVPRAGYPIIGLPVSAFHRGLSLKNLAFPFRLLASMIKANSVIRKFSPHLVIGTGGFASGPVLRTASRKGVPTLIQEQNSFPGMTNRLLSSRVSAICVAFGGMEKYFPAEKIYITGNPVRSDLVTGTGVRQEALARFGLTGDRPVILVFGGSQGSRTLNLSLHAKLGQLAGANVDIIWQTGKLFHPTADEAVNAHKAGNIRVMEFIEDMKYAYAVANLVVCRSGAISLSELALLGKPAILVPLPSAAENHQEKNARAFVDAGAAMLVHDGQAPEKLVDAMLGLVNDTPRLESMSLSMSGFAKPDAVPDIVKIALNLLTS